MFTYQFQTKQEKRKTPWKIPKRMIGKRVEYETDLRGNVTKYCYRTDKICVSAKHELWEDGELKSKTRTEYLNDPLNITGYSQGDKTN